MNLVTRLNSVPTEGNDKVSWYEDDEPQIYLIKPIQPSVLNIGYFIVAGL